MDLKQATEGTKTPRFLMKHFLGLVLLLNALCAVSQIHDMRWLGGYLAGPSPEWGGNKTLLQASPPAVSVLEEHGLYINRTVGVYTDDHDSIVAYTNGWNVSNAALQVMPNGSGLNPSNYFSSEEGFPVPSTHIFLPWPGKPDSVAMIHMIADTVSGQGTFLSARLYLSIVDRSMTNGLGDLTLKNHVLIEEPLICGGLSSVRHANGRDWWIFTHGFMSNEFISFILTPYGFEGPYYQSIGSIRTGPAPGAAFSMDGARLASSATGSAGAGLDVFDFDRCTGMLSNWQHAGILDPILIRSSAFSPNGEFIYVGRVDIVYQYPLVNGVLGDPDTVAVYDGFVDGSSQLATYFSWGMSLAPNGWIYIATGNGTHYMHTIHSPDLSGPSCTVVQHEHALPTWTINCIPYRPNYLLGPVDGTVCDSLGITVNLSEASMQDRVRVQPNPSSGDFSISYPGQSQPGLLEIMDVSGRVAYRHRLSAWSTVHQMDLTGQPSGIYHCRLKWGNRATSIRVIIQP